MNKQAQPKINPTDAVHVEERGKRKHLKNIFLKLSCMFAVKLGLAIDLSFNLDLLNTFRLYLTMLTFPPLLHGVSSAATLPDVAICIPFFKIIFYCVV